LPLNRWPSFVLTNHAKADKVFFSNSHSSADRPLSIKKPPEAIDESAVATLKAKIDEEDVSEEDGSNEDVSDEDGSEESEDSLDEDFVEIEDAEEAELDENR
jgi:hypothetical protein